MAIQSTISAFQSILPDFEFAQPSSFSEGFAQARYQKKMERPIGGREQELAHEAWESYLQFDRELPTEIILPHPVWYRARNLIHQWIRNYRTPSDIDFPSGSSFISTKGQNSIECWLSVHKWTCTHDNFDEFAKVVGSHKALKRALRRRYHRWYQKAGFDLTLKESNRLLWERLRCPNKILKWKLERVTQFVRGSRFSTVPKNNLVRRPINIEPFGNILVQRRIGVGLRNCLLDNTGIDLTMLADFHKERLVDDSIATIDLKNASDAISIALVRFLFPSGFAKKIFACRSELLYGLDGDYHVPRKISSMGNGFTFELMTVILTALCKSLDPNATVFGDDIIISKDKANELIDALSIVGFVVNKEKSFIDGPFRESCGGNFHDEEGYVKSYDFAYPENIADCAIAFNKVSHLAECYPSFAELRERLFSHIPRALRGGCLESSELERRWDDPDDLPVYFACGENYGEPVKAHRLKKELCLTEVKVFTGFSKRMSLRSPTISDLKANWHWGKYEMYMHAGRVTPDVLKGKGAWVERKFVQADGRIFLASSLGIK